MGEIHFPRITFVRIILAWTSACPVIPPGSWRGDTESLYCKGVHYSSPELSLIGTAENGTINDLYCIRAGEQLPRPVTLERKLILVAAIPFFQLPPKACDHRSAWNRNWQVSWGFHPLAQAKGVGLLLQSLLILIGYKYYYNIAENASFSYMCLGGGWCSTECPSSCLFLQIFPGISKGDNIILEPPIASL